MASTAAIFVGVSGFRRPNAQAYRQRKYSQIKCVATNGNGTPADLAKIVLPDGLYCEKTWQTKRRPTRTVEIGKVKVGSDHPIALQTMTTADTRDVDKTVDEVMRVADAGADICRITVQGMQEARAAAKIRDELFKKGYDIPLVADIHFAPKVAMLVADCFEKIRVNPGNFVDGAKKFDTITYDTPEEYQQEVDYIEEVFTPLVEKCKKLNRAMRIGTNHGSLSARILSYYGDTPAGMVESAFEFARVCRKNDYHNFVFSMKASNPLVMVQAYRLLAAQMYEQGWDYPLHLGVTEAGEGEDGRMKSAIGIGSLLMDGLGDTIRVSLTEAPELEIDPCRRLAQLGTKAVEKQHGVPQFKESTRDFKSYERRQGRLPEQRGNDPVDLRGLLHRDGSVLQVVSLADMDYEQQLYVELGCKLAVGMPFKDIATTDSIFLPEVPTPEMSDHRRTLRRLQESNVGVLAPLSALQKNPLPNSVAVLTCSDLCAYSRGELQLPEGVVRIAVSLTGLESAEELSYLKQFDKELVMAILSVPPEESRIHRSRLLFEYIVSEKLEIPVIHHLSFDKGTDRDDLVITSGSVAGALLVDGLGDGIMIDAPRSDFPLNDIRLTSFALLQGSRMRNTKTEFVSCPSCGRTLFDLQEVTDQISKRTGHLPGVSIAIMGCIVNGPGEMADADFGYVGGAPGKIDLYVGKEVVERAIPMVEACDRLIDLIKRHGRWVDKEEEEEESMAVTV